MMNHPFPAVIPLLRRIYERRFSKLLFLVPFERMADEDVVTVYRGSYCHAAYVTDALHRLATIDCDYFMFVHDDVLLNPKLDEASFPALFPLGPDDGFIPWVSSVPEYFADWIWYPSLVPKLLHPKSLLFGSGIEPDNLVKYLPSADRIREGLWRGGASFTERVKMRRPEGTAPNNVDTIGNEPSVVLLDGLAARRDPADPGTAAIDRESLAAMDHLFEAMVRARSTSDDAAESMLELPIPLVASAYYTDCYILPRSKLADYAHHMGVAGAAGLFVEIITPVLLYGICDRVFTADQLGLEFSGFRVPRSFDYFQDRRNMAIHPFKLSRLRTSDQQDAFMSIIAALRADTPIDSGMISVAGFPATMLKTISGSGWHRSEGWGQWMAEPHATVDIVNPVGGTVSLLLMAPNFPGLPLAGKAGIGGCEAVAVVIEPGADLVVTLDTRAFGAGVPLTIDIVAHRTARPCDIDSGSTDRRPLGFGLRGVIPG